MKQQNIRPLSTSVDFAGTSGKVAVSHPVFAHDTARPVLVVIDPRYLEREAFVGYLSMTSAEKGVQISGFASIEEWSTQRPSPDRGVTILLNIGASPGSDPACRARIKSVADHAAPLPIVVLGESSEFGDLVASLEAGAQGYLPTSVGIDRIVEYARLVTQGGVFLPRATVLAMREAARPTPVPQPAERVGDVFTGRQLDVCNALRMGKSNKIIAYDLELRESTVKVHIRNIMKKLSATNRTEAALKLNTTYFGGVDGGSKP